MKTQHTPTPFDFGVREDGTIWIEGGKPALGHHFMQDFYGTKEDAEYIKNAVNSHDELLAALKAFVNAEKSFRANSNPADYPPKEGDDMTAAYDLAVATLAKCERAAQ